MSGSLGSVTYARIREKNDTLTLTEIADAVDTLADVMVSDRMDELAGHNASFLRDAALVLRGFAEEVADEVGPVKEDRDE